LYYNVHSLVPPKLFGKLRRGSDTEKGEKSSKPAAIVMPENKNMEKSSSPTLASNSIAKPNDFVPQKQATSAPPKAVKKVNIGASKQYSKVKGKRRGKNTVVVSMQMPEALVKVLDEIADAGAFRNRSDVILQAVRAYPEVSRRLSKLEARQSKIK
jgi:hypothetical protein